MKLPPWWKVEREVWRIRDKVERWLSKTVHDPIRRELYDRFAHRMITIAEGQRPLTDRVAVYVVFQPNGILASTLMTLDHLRDNGWSVMIVANHSINNDDRAALLERCGVLMTRPNVGYDFGAYREGIMYLWDKEQTLDKLIIMNDSTWFPIRRDDTSLQRMEALDADMTGHIYKIEATEKRGRDHIESHLLMFGPKYLHHPGFKKFWTNYAMSDSRDNTIIYGEKQVTQTALKHGLDVRALHGREQLLEIFNAMSDADLMDAIDQMVHHRRDAREYCQGLLQRAREGKPWREDYLEWVYHALSNSRQHVLSITWIETAIRDSGMGFVKKSGETRHQMGRLAMLDAQAKGRVEPFDPIVNAEIEAVCEAWTPPFDWRAKPGQKTEMDV